MKNIGPDISKGRYFELIFILALLVALTPLSIDMYLPALPRIGQDYNVSTAIVQHTLASFFIGFAIGQAFYGPVADRFGRKRPLVIALIVFVVASFACAFSTNVDQLVVWRFVQAFGGCAGAVISRAMVRDIFDPKDAPKIYALLMLVIGLAPMLAPLLGGWILVYTDWHAIFLVLGAFGLLGLLLLLTRIPETAHNRSPIGPIQAVLVYAALFKDRHFMGHSLAGGFSMAAILAYVSGAAFVFIENYGVDALHFGWIFLTNALGMVIFAQINGFVFSKRFSPFLVLKYAQYVQAFFALVLGAMAYGGWFGMWGVLAPLFFIVALNGMIAPNAAALAMEHQAVRAGSASALLGSVQFGLGALAAVAVGLLQGVSSLAMGMVMIACTLLAPVATALLLRK